MRQCPTRKTPDGKTEYLHAVYARTTYGDVHKILEFWDERPILPEGFRHPIQDQLLTEEKYMWRQYMAGKISFEDWRDFNNDKTAEKIAREKEAEG